MTKQSYGNNECKTLYANPYWNECWPSSVTGLDDLLHFGQLFKAYENNYFAQIDHIWGNFCMGIKIFQCSSEIIFEELL